MITFLLACAGLVLLSGLFYLFPSRRRGSDADLEHANLEWYRLRRRELAREAGEDLERDAQLRLLEDRQAGPSGAPEPPPASGRFPAWLLLPVVALGAGLLYHKLGAAPDVLLSQRLQQLDESAGATEVYALMSAIERRSSQRPDNLHYRALLGRYYMGQEEYSRAASTYTALAEAAPGDAHALAYAAQARYLAAGRVLDSESQHLAEQALAINPHQRTALGLLGMVSFEQERYRAAIEYWERLRATEQAGSDSDRMIAGVIAQARERLGEGAPSPEAGPTGPVAEAGPEAGLTVRVALPEGANLSPDDTVYVLARNAAGDSRMPIAVQRLRAAQLPLTLRLDDSNSMAGQKLSASGEVVVVVQVSPSGQPGEANASWLGRSGPVLPGSGGDPLEITLAPR
ncbi:c-type cytochrome biogenesis protein CcmI [Parahaliea mediterranea]|uniref:C-type cytochrome biogenesis protein CcmI n=1 Tax=Parahaliea mediterranea TaxID=651086 RepID=A0A939DKA3_9GAMM|nr:c-type cytochrome biogenesis protein CcmI [Parahaliea mediterranea]MBN7798972.1 c-type cytochrome biogenesis protein CcmI [Parahaliea mediterranea]